MKLSRTQFIAGLAAAPALRASVADAQSPPPQLIRIGGGPTDSYIEPFLALDGGFFQRAGLNVEVTPLSNGAAIAAAVAGGALDVGLGDMNQIANAVIVACRSHFLRAALYIHRPPRYSRCV